MLTLLLHRQCARDFYRVDVCDNLFGEYTVQREWGRHGRATGMRSVLFSNLRDAVQAADTWRMQAARKGYALTEAAAS
ncbi:WGR domain-containing protein [Thioclava sp. GXIMD4216]|uniref:WGR domain-containing protein n=1 Tax=Thioclava litoralis TaxID=3076557 RepID=A0ABZ1E0T9_9RHOB|nr:WGR domain-containing protein [Thioclava sp. FTW29]